MSSISEACTATMTGVWKRLYASMAELLADGYWANSDRVVLEKPSWLPSYKYGFVGTEQFQARYSMVWLHLAVVAFSRRSKALSIPKRGSPVLPEARKTIRDYRWESCCSPWFLLLSRLSGQSRRSEGTDQLGFEEREFQFNIEILWRQVEIVNTLCLFIAD